MTTTIRNLDKELFNEFKSYTIKEGLNLGEALNLVMSEWLSRKKTKKTLSLLSLKPISWGKGTERVSSEIDKIIYER